MNLFILRHGQAEDYAASDSQRTLTDVGRQQTQELVDRQQAELKSVTHIYASPYIRAQQTASIVAAVLDLPIITVPHLLPEAGVQAAVEFLSEFEQQTPLCVSHQPLVGSFVNWLCGLEYGQYMMGTSALAYMSTDVLAQGCGELFWLRQPK
jgi:phosphohistidine phosphatase